MEADENNRNVYIPSPSDLGGDVSDKLKVTCETDVDDASGDAKLSKKDDLPVIECPVCLQPCVHPVQLPCSHVFCFLCVKGVANRSKRCALCRQEIPLSYFHNPKLVFQEELVKTAAFEDGYQWFYEGRNGWWQYDERTSTDLEDKYKAGEKSFELLIAGFLYVIDLDSMLQYRRNDPTRRRRIKRDFENIPEKKGVAGLRAASNPNPRQGAYGVETLSGGKGQPSPAGDGQSDGRGQPGPVHVTPPTPHNTPQDSQSPATPGLSDSGLNVLMEDLQISHSGDGRSTSPDHSVNGTGVHVRTQVRASRHAGEQRSLSTSPTSTVHTSVLPSQRTGSTGHSPSSPASRTAVISQRSEYTSTQPRNTRVSMHSGRECAEGSSGISSVTNTGNMPVRRIHSSASAQSSYPSGASMDSDLPSRVSTRQERPSERQRSPHDHSS